MVIGTAALGTAALGAGKLIGKGITTTGAAALGAGKLAGKGALKAGSLAGSGALAAGGYAANELKEASYEIYQNPEQIGKLKSEIGSTAQPIGKAVKTGAKISAWIILFLVIFGIIVISLIIIFVYYIINKSRES